MIISKQLENEITKETGIDALIYTGQESIFTRKVLVIMPYQYSFGRGNDSSNKKTVTVYYNLHWAAGQFENELEIMNMITEGLWGARYDIECSSAHLGFLAFSMLELARQYEYEMITGKIKEIKLIKG